MEQPPIRVLYVEDNEFFARVASDVLESDADMQVHSERVGVDALARLREERFDCVVSDYEMPGMDGLELLDAIRVEDEEIPFILFTGGGSEETASEAISAGVTDYLQKRDGRRQFAVLANRIENAVSRRRAEKSARRQMAINDLVWDVSQSLLQASSRDGIERAVCERLADSESYLFTWIGEVDDDSVVPRTSTGIEEGYLDAVFAETEADPGTGPVYRAVETNEVQITQDIAAEVGPELWREKALERGYHSKAAIPLVYEERTYGVLNVYADQPHAFDDAERRVLSKFGDSIAYAMNSVRTREELVRREQRLQVFNRILRHNLRNDLNVVLGHADNLMEDIDAVREEIGAVGGTEGDVSDDTEGDAIGGGGRRDGGTGGDAAGGIEDADANEKLLSNAFESAETVKRKASELIDISEKAREVGRTLDRDEWSNKAVEMSALVERALGELQGDYPDADLTANLPEAAWAYGDETLDAVVGELVENAIEHSDRNLPDVSLSILRTGACGDGWVELAIADDGPGIPVGERAVLKEGRETALEHGSGLGLWLTNWVVGKFGGELDFTDNDPRGSVVTVRLRRAEPKSRECQGSGRSPKSE